MPPDVLKTLRLQDQPTSSQSISTDALSRESSTPKDDDPAAASSCSLCKLALKDAAERRQHVKSDWHGYNLKQKLRGLAPVDEATFDRLVGELDESISGSDSSSSNDEGDAGGGGGGVLSQLLKRQAKIADATNSTADEGTASPRRTNKAPVIWFTSPALPPKMLLGVYRALFTQDEVQQVDVVATLSKKQLKPQDARQMAKNAENDGLMASTEPHVFLCMIGGGHFAAMVVSLAPKLNKSAKGVSERQAIIVAHKTFHRYTTRRKQGGSQSANDASKGNAHSAGAGIRRANEAALEAEVRSLLLEWKAMIDKCQLLFIRATGATNRRTLFGPYEKQVLRSNDVRIRTFPFSTRRATQSELMRAFVELTRAKVSEIQDPPPEESKLSSSTSTPAPQKAAPPKPSAEEEAALLHTSQLQALVKRSKVPALLQYLSKNSLSPDYRFHPPSSSSNRHAPTPLHLAASNNVPVMVQALLCKANADPTVQSEDGKVPFELAGDRATRDAFRVARAEVGEGKWAWDKARCPPGLSKEEAKAREKAEHDEARSKESERRDAQLKRLAAESEAQANASMANSSLKSCMTLAKPETTAADRREEEMRGLTPEQRAKLERERRARAAEERIRRMAGR